MKIITLPLGPLETNCYLVYDEESKEAMVIDPGANGARIVKEIAKNGLVVKYIVNTHGHGDHIGANLAVKEATQAPVLIHEADAAMLTDPELNLSIYLGTTVDKPAPDGLLREGDVLSLGQASFTVLHTPGHTPGGISLVGGRTCFSGDTLFDGSVGRSDFAGGSHTQLIASIMGKLMTLEDQVEVYPGHGPQTTIGRERADNPFLVS